MHCCLGLKVMIVYVWVAWIIGGVAIYFSCVSSIAGGWNPANNRGIGLVGNNGHGPRVWLIFCCWILELPLPIVDENIITSNFFTIKKSFISLLSSVVFSWIREREFIVFWSEKVKRWITICSKRSTQNRQPNYTEQSASCIGWNWITFCNTEWYRANLPMRKWHIRFRWGSNFKLIFLKWSHSLIKENINRLGVLRTY